ncbi:MAG: SRPBCC family protein, partial [Candidatus Hermodarchaeota archaeon]
SDNMTKFKISININKYPEIVWKAYINPHNMIKWTRNLEKVEVIKGQFGEIGAIAHLHYLEKGRPYVLEDKLLSYEHGKRILSQVTGQGMIIEVETIFNSLPNGTNILMSWKGTSKSVIMRIVLRLLQKKITKQAEAELNKFKSLVETHGVNFYKEDS